MAITEVREGTFLNIEYFFFKVANFFDRLFGGGFSEGSSNGFDSNSGDFSSGGGFGGWLSGFGAVLFWILFIICLLLIIAIIYSHLKNKEEDEKRIASIHDRVIVLMQDTEEEQKTTIPARFERLNTLINSTSDSDWKLAIIEADTVLDEITKALELPGDSLGERMRAADPHNWRTLQSAWDAHKVRNQIAHDASFVLTQRQAKETLSLFHSVFREFGLIE